MQNVRQQLFSKNYSGCLFMQRNRDFLSPLQGLDTFCWDADPRRSPGLSSFAPLEALNRR